MMEEEGIEIYGYTDKPKQSHASVRSKERYGHELSKDDLHAMSLICQGSDWRRDYQKSLGYNKHHIHVQYNNVWWNVIYSDSTHMIVTILHPKHDPKPKQQG